MEQIEKKVGIEKQIEYSVAAFFLSSTIVLCDCQKKH